jgi:hypothetical protein
MKVIFSLILFLSVSFSVFCQSNQIQYSNSVKISTRIIKLPSKAEQVTELEYKLSEAKKVPELVNNGTVAKYAQALEQKRKEYELEEKERLQLESTDKK